MTVPRGETPPAKLRMAAGVALGVIAVCGVAVGVRTGLRSGRVHVDPAAGTATPGRHVSNPEASRAAPPEPTRWAPLPGKPAQGPGPSSGTGSPDTPNTRVSTASQDAPQFLEAALDTVVSIEGRVEVDGRTTHVIGSGFFVSTSGLVLSNAHVMAHKGLYWAKAHDGRRLELLPRERDLRLDLGILAVVGEGPFPVLPFGSSAALRAGSSVYAIGSPFSEELGFSVTRGIVSSRTRIVGGRSFVQHDAAINPGNSGGPLLDGFGRIVGINTWKIAGAETQGLSFAIPIEVAEEVLRLWKVRG